MNSSKPVIIILGLLMVALSVKEAASLCLPLSVRETANITRTDMPVQSGIPMPMGAFQPADLGKFMVLDSTGPDRGNPVPAAFAVTATWRDGSIRFLNVQFRATVAGNTGKTYYLTDNNQNVPGDSIAVTGVTGGFQVETGVLKFTVKGSAFNLIDEAYVDLSGARNYTAANRVVQAGHNGGFVINGQRSSGGSAAVTVFRKTREQVTLRAEGTVGEFPYLVFITAFCGKPYVKIWHNFYFNNADPAASTQLSNVSLELPTLVTGARNVTMGNNRTRPSASFTQDAAEAVSAVSVSASRQSASPCYRLFKGAVQQDSGISMANPQVGWMQVSGGGKGIGIGVRYFWEMYPKVIEMQADGRAILGLYSYQASPLTYYSGGGRTHQAVISFGTDTNMIKEAFFMTTQPIYPKAPAVWYCGMTKCMGDLLHADPSLLASASDSMYARYQTFFNRLRSAKDMQSAGARFAPSCLNSVNPVKDLFGFVAFGDNTDPTNESCLSQQHYSGNYYDYPFVCLESFCMNGEHEALIRATECALQMADIEHFNTTGDARGCPVVDHWFCYYDADVNGNCATLYPWGNANHWKSQSLFGTWWFTGEPMFLELGKRLNKFAKNNDAAIANGQARSAGHILMGLSAEYESEWDVTVRDRMRFFWDNGVQGFSSACQTRESEFLNPVVMTGLIYAMWADPGYANWRTGLRTMVASLVAGYDYSEHGSCQTNTPSLNASELGGYAVAMDSMPDLVPSVTPVANDLVSMYFDATNKYYQVSATRQKEYVENMKYIQLWFHRAVKDPNYLAGFPAYTTLSGMVAAEGGVRSGAVRGNAFEARPNPFNPSVIVKINPDLVSLCGSKGLTAAIYDVSGRFIELLTPSETGGRASRGLTYTWNAGHRASGIFIIQVTAGNKSYGRKIVLVK